MIVKLIADRQVRLEDRDNFRAFKLVIEGNRKGIDAARQALVDAAELVDADTAWVSQDALRTRPEVVGDTAWQQSFAAMIEKARPHGRIDDGRKAIKAHVEWTGQSVCE